MTVQSNTRREYTAADLKQVEIFERQIANDHPQIAADSDMLDKFFQANRQVPVTLANIYHAVGLSSLEGEWYELAQQNRELANQLAANLAAQGHPGQLVNNGEQLFKNLILLFREIHSHPQPMAHAIDRINHRPGARLHFVPQPRRTEPVSSAAKADPVNSTNWLGRQSDMVKLPDGSYRSKNAHEQRADREAAEAAKSQTQTATALSASDQQWRSMALEATRYGTHSDQAQLRRVFEQHNGAPWREVYEAVNQVRSALIRRREQMPA